MAHTGIFATLAEVTAAAGENVDATGFVEANINAWCSMSEAILNCVCAHNFSDTYASLNVDTKRLLAAASAAWVAIQAIMYNMSGYTSRIEAEDMINVHRDVFLLCVSILRVKDTRRFINES